MTFNQFRVNSDPSSATTLRDEAVTTMSESQSSISTLPVHHDHHQPYFDDDDEGSTSDFCPARPQSFASSFFSLLGMTVRQRGRQNDIFDDYFINTPKHAFPPIDSQKSRHGSPREVRICRRRHVANILKRAILLLPVLALIFFGLLYLLQALLGEARLFWGIDALEEYLPDWDKPGNPGENLSRYPTDATRDVIPISCHSHNDYWRRIPLYEAIHTGCTSVEADVWLFDDELYVGHSTSSLTPNRTFASLYINPLVSLLDAMNPSISSISSSSSSNNNTTTTTNTATTKNGIFSTDPTQTLVLLIDFKTHGPSTYPHVLRHLTPLREKGYLTHHDGTTLHQRPITIVGTGNTPFSHILTTHPHHREIFFDAPLSTLSEGIYNSTNTFYASTPFSKSIGSPYRHRSRAHLLSPSQLSLLRSQISAAHALGLKVRYWDTPTWPRWVRDGIWETLWVEGVDVLNVDDLRAVAKGSWGGWGKG